MPTYLEVWREVQLVSAFETHPDNEVVSLILARLPQADILDVISAVRTERAANEHRITIRLPSVS